MGWGQKYFAEKIKFKGYWWEFKRIGMNQQKLTGQGYEFQ